MTTLELATDYARAGLSVIPVRPDASKAAAVAWREFQRHIPSADELRRFFSNGNGIAAIGGAVSGHLEILDFETGAPFDEWSGLIETHEPELATRLVIVETPSGGRHVYYRCPDGIEGNQKLAMAEGGKVSIETRGEGGYVLAPGSPNACHPAGKQYRLLQGDLIPGAGEHSIPTITAAQRSLLLDAARSFNAARKSAQEPDAGPNGVGRPGDMFNDRESWQSILEPHGWTRLFERGGETYWRRPGKDSGLSATTGFKGKDLLYVFSTNAAPLHADTSHSKFGAFAALEHGGDFKAAASAIADRYQIPHDSAARVPAQPNVNPAASKYYPTTEAGNGEFIAAVYGHRFRHDHSRGRDLLFDGVCWREDTGGELAQMAKAAARQRFKGAASIDDRDERERQASWAFKSESKARIDSALALARTEPPVADSGADWDSRPMALACKNGVIDLETGKLRPGDPGDKLTLRTPIAFDPSAECPQFERFLSDVLSNDPELVSFVLRAIGYSLTGRTTEQVLFILWGAGANGKSVLLAVMRHVFGDVGYNMPFSTVEMKDRSAIPNDLAALANRRLVTSSETNDGVRFNEARIKALTGGDPVTARFLHHEYFTFNPVAKFWLAVNHKPRVSDDSYGFWRRVRLIPFLRQFRGDAADPHMETKLLSEAPGILAFFVRACLDWQSSGLRPPAMVDAATADYEAESDPLADFFSTRCDIGEGFSEPAGELYKAYKIWADGQGLREREILSANSFGRRIGDRFSKVRNREGAVYQGVKLRV